MPHIGWRDVYSKAAAFLRAHQPAFVWLAMHETHEYLKPSVASYQRFAHLAEPQRIYAATVADMDGAVGGLLDEIEASGRKESTLVLFWSDK